MSEVSLAKLPSGVCHGTSLTICQHWFRKWLGAVRQRTILCANVNPDRCHNMMSLGHIVFMCPLSWIHRRHWRMEMGITRNEYSKCFIILSQICLHYTGSGCLPGSDKVVERVCLGFCYSKLYFGCIDESDVRCVNIGSDKIRSNNMVHYLSV